MTHVERVERFTEEAEAALKKYDLVKAFHKLIVANAYYHYAYGIGIGAHRAFTTEQTRWFDMMDKRLKRLEATFTRNLEGSV